MGDEQMWPFSRRARDYQRLLQEFEEFLVGRGIVPTRYCRDNEILRYLTYWPINRIWYTLSIFREVDWYISADKRRFAKLIRKYRRGGLNTSDLIYGKPPNYYRYLVIGSTNNPNFEEEEKRYARDVKEYEAITQKLKAECDGLLKSPEGQILSYVKEEDRKASEAGTCTTCYGGGIIPSMTGGADYPCFSCDGTGYSGDTYTARVSPEQRAVASEVQRKLAGIRAKMPSSPSKPRPELTVYVRI